MKDILWLIKLSATYIVGKCFQVICYHEILIVRILNCVHLVSVIHVLTRLRSAPYYSLWNHTARFFRHPSSRPETDPSEVTFDSTYIYGSENHDKILAELGFDQALNSSGPLVYLSLEYLITLNFRNTLISQIWGGHISQHLI